jgi:hypothetical protein
MEGEKHWRPLNEVSIPVFGASSTSLNDSVYLIGGQTAGNKNPQTVLQVRNFDLNTMNWNPMAINANKTLNRAYHASASLGDSVYIFGGAAASLQGGQETLLSEVVKCTPGSLEGLKCVPTHSPSAERKGHSASTMGAGDLMQKIVLFGGSSAEGTCDSSDLLVYVGDDEVNMGEDGDVLKCVPCNGPAPSPRSHHATAVAGRRLEYLIVSAGWDGANAFDDLWLCDTTNILSGRSLEPEEVIPVKGKKKDEAPIPELYTWHQIHLAEPMEGRFMHGCWATCAGTLDDGLRIGVFGGMSSFGPIGHESMLQYVVEFDGKECTAQLEFAPETDRDSSAVADDTRYGFNTETIYENGIPALIFVFGGKHLNCFSECCVLDENADISAHLAACLPLPNADEEEEESNIKVINYPNGDVYEGEVFVDIDEQQSEVVASTPQIRHGQGVMKYADGAVYEVSTALHVMLYIQYTMSFCPSVLSKAIR